MPLVVRALAIGMHAGKCEPMRELMGGRIGFKFTRAMELENVWWQPESGFVREVTYQTLHYHYGAFYPLADWLESGRSNIRSDGWLTYPYRCFNERPVPGVLVQYATMMTDMHALSVFVSVYFDKDGNVNHALPVP